MSHLPPELLALAARQHCVFSRRQAIDVGLTRHALEHRIDRQVISVVVRGVYTIAGVPLSWRGRLLALCLSSAGVASHRSCSALNCLDGFRPGVPELTVPRHRRSLAPGAIWHESKDFDRVEPVLIDAIPSTSPARLAVDLGAVVPFARYELAMDEMIRRHLITWDDALDSLVRHARRGRNGVGALRALLAERYGDVVPDSALERAFLTIAVDAGLPTPVGQHEVFDHAGFVARVDFAYPELKIAIELDSKQFHLRADAFEADRAKRNRLRLDGWLVLEFTWSMLTEHPGLVARQIRDALRARNGVS